MPAVAAQLGGELQPFQWAGVRYVLDARRVFLSDEQGLGKTIEALATLEEDDAYPAVVLCPASLKLNWQREAGKWLPHRKVTVVPGTGMVPDDGADVTILLRANAVSYALKKQDASGLSFGKKQQTQPPRVGDDVAALVKKGVPVFYVEEDLAVLAQLCGADAMHGAHFGDGCGLSPRHVDQRLVGKYHIGGDPLLLREF